MMFTSDVWRVPPGWLSGRGPSADIVISTRCRVARNLAGTRFPHMLDDDALAEVRDGTAGALLHTGRFAGGWELDINALSSLEREALREMRLASRDLVREPAGRGLVVSSDRARAAMINEEDHLRLQVFRPGFDPLAAVRDVLACDAELEHDLQFSFSDEVGYLTACPTNVGTACRLSVLIHLPGLVLGGEIEKVLNSLRQLQFNVRGADGEGSPVRGALFQISNLGSLGRTEEELAAEFARHVSKVIHYERLALERIYERDRSAVEDFVHRSLALLQHARVMTGQEALDRLSQVRLGVMLDLLPPIPLETLNQAIVHHQTAHLQLAAGRDVPTAERSVLRADLLRTLLRDA